MLSRSARVGSPAAGLVVVAMLLVACKERTPNYCEKASDCSGDRVCNIEARQCVLPDGGGPGSCLVSSDCASKNPALPACRADGQCVQCSSAADCSGTTPLCGSEGECQGCKGDGDCAGLNDPDRALCATGGACVQCTASNGAACTGGMCDTSTNRCVGCVTSANCPGAAPICSSSKECTGCREDAECAAKSAALPACRVVDGQCVQCKAATACSGATPVCNTTTNACVQCTSAANCSGSTPICGADQKCEACAADAECAALNDPARAACGGSGACVQCTASNSSKCTGTSTAVCNPATNKCVGCLTDESCVGTTPICEAVTNTCRGCANAGECSGFAGLTACAASGACVQCTDNSTCSGTTPICATVTNTCRKCATDSECTAIGPGVCTVDGHCATDAETVYVGTLGAATCDESNTGTAQQPVCSVQKGVTLAKASPGSKPVVVVRGSLTASSTSISVSFPLTIVGRNNATITSAAGADCITINQGEIHLRSLTIVGSASAASAMGINATSGVTLTMDGCKITNNPGGGIFLNGAAFDIENTTVSGNGPGQTTGGTLWGGIRVERMPPTGSPATLKLLTIQNNSPIGLSCSATIPNSTSVLATGNNSSTNPTYQISGCGFSSCTPGVETACGAP